MPPNLRHVIWRPCASRTCRHRYSSRATSQLNVEWDDTLTEEDSWREESFSVNDKVSRQRYRRAFSGIQPTGVPHLGNYLGALRPWKMLHDQSHDPAFTGGTRHQQYYSVVDLHALTGDTPPQERLRLRKESYAALLAMGLCNTKQTTLFFQSNVPQHSELMWILSTLASTGYLSRMTQWKSKLNLPDNVNLDSDEATAKLKLGLFSYPVLQAADILLYRPSIVPVGQDQLQHIEFTRKLARSFNSLVAESWGGNVFKVPWPFISPAKKIMSLKRPTQKMSKSDQDPKSQILITDTEEEIHAKIRGAVTDSEPGISYDPEKRPGVSNLIEILHHLRKDNLSFSLIANDNENVGMRAFKEEVANAIVKELRGTRERFMEYMRPEDPRLYEEIRVGARKARIQAGKTLDDVRQAIGLFDFTERSRNAFPTTKKVLAVHRDAGRGVEADAAWDVDEMEEDDDLDDLEEDGEKEFEPSNR